MTAKEYLSQAWNIDRRINDKVTHVSQLRDMATNVSAVISDMPRNPSPNNQRMENIIARLTDTEDEINADDNTRMDDEKFLIMLSLGGSSVKSAIKRDFGRVVIENNDIRINT